MQAMEVEIFRSKSYQYIMGSLTQIRVPLTKLRVNYIVTVLL